MSLVPFYVVDVFSRKAYHGNPLAIVDNMSAKLSLSQMKLIARQFNLSETTFFEKPTGQKASYRLRSFYPDGTEVFGSGHNILGVWWFLAQTGRLDWESADTGTAEKYTFHQELGQNVSPVYIERKKDEKDQDHIVVAIRQHPPGFHGKHPDANALAASVGLEPTDIGIVCAGETLQPQMMSTSTTRHLMVPVATVDALNRVSVERDELARQLALVDDSSYGIYFFTKIEGENVYQARFFSTGMSAEDPATGSAAGPLSAYLYRHGHLRTTDGRGTMTVRQGLMVGRDCLIEVTIVADGDSLEVEIIGSGAHVMSGSLTAPSPEV